MFQTYFNGNQIGTYTLLEDAVAAITADLKAPGKYAVMQGREEAYVVNWAGAPEPAAKEPDLTVKK